MERNVNEPRREHEQDNPGQKRPHEFPGKESESEKRRGGQGGQGGGGQQPGRSDQPHPGQKPGQGGR